MCLALPGKVKSISTISESNILNYGNVEFGGIERVINLSCLPEVKIGDFIIAHAGVGLQILDEEEAIKLISDLEIGKS